jgi:hypothetical protein
MTTWPSTKPQALQDLRRDHPRPVSPVPLILLGNGRMGSMAKSSVPHFPANFDLVAFAHEHLIYDVGMFVESRNRFRSTTPMSYERNAMIELCMIHLRNLIDFFTPPPSSLKPQGDDVIASHYVPDWENHRPNISPSLEATRKRIHKEMAHLTMKRLAGAHPNKLWDFDAVSHGLRPSITAFRVMLANQQTVSLTLGTVSMLQMI